MYCQSLTLNRSPKAILEHTFGDKRFPKTVPGLVAENWRRCHCPKWIRGFLNGKQSVLRPRREVGRQQSKNAIVWPVDFVPHKPFVRTLTNISNGPYPFTCKKRLTEQRLTGNYCLRIVANQSLDSSRPENFFRNRTSLR